MRVSARSYVCLSLSVCLCLSGQLLTHCLARFSASWLDLAHFARQFTIFFDFQTSVKNHDAAFSRAFAINFLSQSRIPKHIFMLHMAMHTDRPLDCAIPIKFKFQIQFVTFIRGHPRTPIDSAPVLLSGKPCSTSHSVWCVSPRSLRDAD